MYVYMYVCMHECGKQKYYFQSQKHFVITHFILHTKIMAFAEYNVTCILDCNSFYAKVI